MQKHGLCILPIGVQPRTEVNTWEEENQYGKKQRQSVFTEATTQYLLLHKSGESQVLTGYGHGVDSQDKGAGKATTYALKYTLLYTFLVPTGKIDDADNTHSDQVDGRRANGTTAPAPQAPQPNGRKPELTKEHARYQEAVDFIAKGGNMAEIEKKFVVPSALKGELLKDAKLTA